MKKQFKKIVVPGLKMRSDYFKCPRCGWVYPGPIRTQFDQTIETGCDECGHPFLVRIK